MKKRSLLRRFLTGIFALSLLLSLGGISPAKALSTQSEESKTVRVAVDNSEVFVKFDESGTPVSGYAYEYIRNIAAYANWEVEYLPAGSFSDCLEMVKSGEADLFYDISYTDERSEWLLYPDAPMGEESYYLFCLGDNSDIHFDDLSTLDCRSVGVTAGTTEHAVMEEWCESKGIEMIIVDFDSDPAKQEAFECGAISMECEVSLLAKTSYSALCKVYSSDFYLVTNHSRADLIRDINTAHAKIENVNQFYLQRLNEKYFGRSIINRSLSTDELVWASSHNTLKVGYREDYMPFSDTDSKGEADGIIKDILPMILENVGLENSFTLDCRGYANDEEMFEALAQGEIDLVFPVMDNIEYATNQGILITTEVISLSADIAYCGSYSEATVSTIAVCRGNSLQEYYTRSVYPDAEILYCDSTDACLRSVAVGEAGSTILNGLRTSSLLANEDYESLVALRLAQPFSFSIGVRKTDSALLSILNRSIASLDEGFAFNFAFNYVGSTESDSISDFIQNHRTTVMKIIIAVLAITLCAVIAVAVMMEKNRKKLAAANAAKTSFLFNMSHDIRTPMNAILGFTDIASKNLGDDDMVEDCLNKTRQASNLLLSLINSVLEMSRIEAGKAELDEQPCRVDLSFAKLESTMMELANEKDIYLSFDYGDIQDNYVYADIDRTDRVFVNIISNSIKYTNPGGRVRVKCEQIGGNGENGMYRYTFEDNGIGMSQEFQQNIFEEFARENTSTISGIQGSGLGLSVAKTFVDLMHGTIECKSELNKGTTFTVTLPFRLQKDTENAQYVEPLTKKIVGVHTESEEGKETDLLGRRVLVVEDNELNREIAFYLLSEEGMVVEEADDGSVAVEMLREKGSRYYDVILMDIQMPKMNGYEATKAIRAMYPDVDLPIIALSANAFAEDKAASLAAGMNGHIAKPIEPAELFAALSAIPKKKKRK